MTEGSVSGQILIHNLKSIEDTVLKLCTLPVCTLESMYKKFQLPVTNSFGVSIGISETTHHRKLKLLVHRLHMVCRKCAKFQNYIFNTFQVMDQSLSTNQALGQSNQAWPCHIPRYKVGILLVPNATPKKISAILERKNIYFFLLAITSELLKFQT